MQMITNGTTSGKIEDSAEEHGLHAELVRNLDLLLATTRPRLLRLAQRQGIAPDAVDDVVQETCVEAWRHIAQLQTPERFEAWLNGICRHVCLRWQREQGRMSQQYASFSALSGAENEDDGLAAIVDADAPDLDEELSRQDLAILLDRAMGYLPENTRAALELYYLAEMPQREVALRLGLTVNALEVKLHHARRQLRQILNQQLRDDALAFGLFVDGIEEASWRPTALWCMFCGKQRLLGCFKTDGEGRNVMRLRCPHCSQQEKFEPVNTLGLVMLENLRSFRPAWKRTLQSSPLAHFLSQGVQQGYQMCLVCKGTVRVDALEPYIYPFSPNHIHYHLEMECSQCGSISCGISSACLGHPQVVQFVLQHPHWLLGTEEMMSYDGQPALRVTLFDLTSAAQLFVFLHAHTLDILGVHA